MGEPTVKYYAAFMSRWIVGILSRRKSESNAMDKKRSPCPEQPPDGRQGPQDEEEPGQEEEPSRVDQGA